jgi:SAM-dependent methyltransferase
MVAHPQWDQLYKTGDLPWDTGEPDNHFVEFVRAHRIRRGRALEVGCGTGTNATWLARQGLDVLGIDVSPSAIEKARARQRAQGVESHFAVLDFLEAAPPGAPFDFVFDRGCFHIFDEADDRDRFAARVAEALGSDGVWLSLIGSTEGPPRDHGPPRRTVREVVATIEPHLQIVELRLVQFRANVPTPALAWLCVSRKRRVAAQPSTRHD